MKFKDIPQFTQAGSYQVNIALKYFDKWIKKNVEDYGLELNPDFQRGHVWTEAQQISYIEFLLRGGKSGRVIYFNNPSWHHSVPQGNYDDFVCVDGLQRTTAILRFLNNEIPAFETYFNEFEDKIPLDVNVLVNVNDLKTKKEVLQWYVEMNDGGTPHTKEEIEVVKKLIEFQDYIDNKNVPAFVRKDHLSLESRYEVVSSDYPFPVICGGFETKEDAMNYVKSNNLKLYPFELVSYLEKHWCNKGSN